MSPNVLVSKLRKGDFWILSEDHLKISAEGKDDGFDCLRELGAMNRLNALPSASGCDSA